jgi:hypothetical protein
MRRREISQALLASATASALPTKRAEAQTSNAARTAAEIAAAVTPTNTAYQPGNPWRYGADGAGGSNDINALATARTIVSTTGVNGWQNGTPIGGFLRTTAEIAASLLATDYSRQTEPYDIRRFGAKLDNASDDTTAVVNALTVGTQTVAAARGGAVSVPAGTSLLSAMVLMPNRVRVLGVNKRGSYFLAKPGWAIGNRSAAWNTATNYVTGNLVTNGGVLYVAKQASLNRSPPNATYWNPISNAMFYAQNGYTAGVGNSMFDSTLENCTVDANNTAGLGCVLSSAWQEDCGLRGVMLINFATYGVKYQDGFGGSSLSKVVDCELFGGTVAGAIGIDLTTPMGAVAAFMLDVSNTSISGGSGGNLAAAISVKGNSLLCRSVHFEVATAGVLIDGSGYISLDDVTCAPTVTSLVTIASTFTGTLVMKNCRRNGATNFINDLRAGGYGAISGTDHPFFIINATDTTEAAKGLPFASGWAVFDGTQPTPITPSGSYNIHTTNLITKNAIGDYTVNLSRAMLSVNAVCFGACNLASTAGSAVSVRADLVGSTSFRIRIYVNGTLTDANEVKAIIFGG